MRFFLDTPTPSEIAYYSAMSRVIRAAALEKGLNPDTTLPEDILLLNKDDKGKLLVLQELFDAETLLKYEFMAEKQKCQV